MRNKKQQVGHIAKILFDAGHEEHCADCGGVVACVQKVGDRCPYWRRMAEAVHENNYRCTTESKRQGGIEWISDEDAETYARIKKFVAQEILQELYDKREVMGDGDYGDYIVVQAIEIAKLANDLKINLEEIPYGNKDN